MFEVDDTGVHWRTDMESGFSLGLSATEIRKERTGIHAVVTIYQDRYSVDYDTFNVGRREDRTRLANAAQKRMGDALIEAKKLGYLVDDFCREIWPKWCTRFAPELVTPDLSEIQPVAFLLEPYVVQGGGTIAFAAPGMGKSYLAMLMAQSINQGCSAFWPVTQSCVLYVNLERSKISMKRRLALVNAALGLDGETPLQMLNARGRTLSGVAETLGGSFDVLFVDSLSRAGQGSLIDDERMNATMDRLNLVAETWVLIAHAPRGDQTHAFGSVMQDAAADLMLQILAQRKEDGTLGVGIQGTKSNDTALPPLTIYAMGFDKYGMSSFRLATAAEFPEIESGRKMGISDQLFQHVLNAGAMDAGAAAAAIGFPRNKISSIFTHDKRFSRTGKDGRKVLYGVEDSIH